MVLPLCLWIVGCDSLAVMREPDPAVRYIAFGDSTTAGPSSRDYPELLAERRNEPAETISNEGKGGERTDDGLVRLRMILDDGLFPAATVLLYWQGGNDLNDFIKGVDPVLLFSPDTAGFPFATELSNALADVQTNVEEAVRLGRGAGLDVYVATYFPLSAGVAECNPLPFDILLPVQADSGNAYLSALNETLRAAAANAGALVVDIESLGEVLLSDSNNYFNCNHLSDIGNGLVAARFDAALGRPPVAQAERVRP